MSGNGEGVVITVDLSPFEAFEVFKRCPWATDKIYPDLSRSQARHLDFGNMKVIVQKDRQGVRAPKVIPAGQAKVCILVRNSSDFFCGSSLA